jgi:hypothetical protein
MSYRTRERRPRVPRNKPSATIAVWVVSSPDWEVDVVMFDLAELDEPGYLHLDGKRQDLTIWRETMSQAEYNALEL